MPIISATAFKGGVGKTTLVHHAAGALALAGKRVLCVDNDAQSACRRGCSGRPPSSRWTRPRPSPRSTRASTRCPSRSSGRPASPGIDVIAGSMAAAQVQPARAASPPRSRSQTCLRSFLAEVRDQYDVILIDNPPNLQAASWAALVASDYLVVPVRARGLRVDVARRPCWRASAWWRPGPNPSVVLLGLVLTMVQPRLGVHIAYEQVLREIHGDGVFATRIPLAADIKEAISQRKPVTHYKPRGASAKVFKALVEEMLARIEAHAVGTGTGRPLEMGKADELLTATVGGRSRSRRRHRGAPGRDADAPQPADLAPDRLAGVARSKAALEIPVGQDRARPGPAPRGVRRGRPRAGSPSRSGRRGVLQPIRVRWDEGRGRYVIIFGERRWRAATDGRAADDSVRRRRPAASRRANCWRSSSSRTASARTSSRSSRPGRTATLMDGQWLVGQPARQGTRRSPNRASSRRWRCSTCRRRSRTRWRTASCRRRPPTPSPPSTTPTTRPRLPPAPWPRG